MRKLRPIYPNIIVILKNEINSKKIPYYYIGESIVDTNWSFLAFEMTEKGAQ